MISLGLIFIHESIRWMKEERSQAAATTGRADEILLSSRIIFAIFAGRRKKGVRGALAPQHVRNAGLRVQDL